MQRPIIPAIRTTFTTVVLFVTHWAADARFWSLDIHWSNRLHQEPTALSNVSRCDELGINPYPEFLLQF